MKKTTSQGELRLVWVLSTATFAVLLYFLKVHWDLGLLRYIDADEFAHLHWASRVAAGKVPYIDFLSFFPPGFSWFLAPVFWVTQGIGPIIAGRIMSFVVFVALGAVSAILFWVLRRSFLAIAVFAILAFLPIPFDKFLEIRPDTLAVFLSTTGLLCAVLYMRHTRPSLGLGSGMLLASSLVVLTKMIPQVAFILFFVVWKAGGEGKWKVRAVYNLMKPVLLGFSGVVGIVGLWAWSLGDLPRVFYSLFTLPFEANRISQQFIMQADLFFYPNTMYYGQEGVHGGLIANHIIWIAGLGMAVYRILTPFLVRGKEAAWEEFLVAASLLLTVVMYVGFIPLKHAQYLIPIGVFVAWYAADFLWEAWKIARTRAWGVRIYGMGYVAMVIGGVMLFASSTGPKYNWVNTATLVRLQEYYRQIDPTEYVLDLEGGMFYNPDPHYACCTPFGQFSQYLIRPLESVRSALERTKAPFIYQGELRRLSTLESEDQAYVKSHYAPVDAEGLLLKRIGE